MTFAISSAHSHRGSTSVVCPARRLACAAPIFKDQETLMLVLTRRVGEEVLIGDNIRVVLIAADKKGARLGIRAPRSVAVHREEIRPRRRQAPGRAGRDERPPE